MSLQIVILFATGTGRAQTLATIVERIEREYCDVIEDDMTGQIREGRILALRQAGEAGRRALLEVVRLKPELRRCALVFLVELDDRRAVPFLREGATTVDVSSSDLRLSLWGLARLQDRDSYNLIAGHLDDRQAPVVESAINALGLLDDERARGKLRQLLVDEQTTYRALVIRSLGRQRDSPAILAISHAAGAASGLKDWFTVLEAITALVAIRTSESLRLAEGHFHQIADARWQTAAIEEVRKVLRMQLSGAENAEQRRQIADALAQVDQWFR